MSTDEAKAELRRFVRLTRGARSSVERDAAEERLRDVLDYLADEFSWRRIAGFIPTPTEPPIARGLDDLVRDGVTVIVPVASTNGLMEWRELTAGGIFETSVDDMNMPIPVTGEPTAPRELDAVLVPAAAADRRGNRLGWGKGFYDRFLDSVSGDPLVIAVVFDADVLDEVPTEPHDQPVDAVLTDTEIFFVQ